MDSVFYSELTPRAFKKRIEQAPVAYLPLGTLEWHGEHLPLGADGIQSGGFFGELAALAGGVVLPVLFLGPDVQTVRPDGEYYGMDIYGFSDHDPRQLAGSAYFISEDDFGALLANILKQLKRAGFRIVVAHGHGPSTNYFAKRMAEWEKTYGLHLMTCFREHEDIYGIQTDHAAANETSLVMALRPELVHMENLDPDPAARLTAVHGQDPRRFASPELGRQAIDMQKARMAARLGELLQQIRKSEGQS